MPSRRCPHCKVESSYGKGPETKRFNKRGHLIRFDSCTNDECQCNVAVVFDSDGNEIEVYPSLEEEPDRLLPPDVAKAFGEALQALNERLWNGCVLMCRRALEEGTAELGNLLPENGREAYQKKVLYLQIRYLANEHLITPDLGEWAHEGRMAGKLGAHGGEKKKWNTERDAVEIVEFAKWFFRYVFILPKQLAERRQEAEEHPDETTPPELIDEGAQETLEHEPGEQ